MSSMKFKNSEVFKLLNSAKDKEEITLSHLNRNEDQSPILPVTISGGENPGNHAGQANEALFSSPFGIAAHPNGSIYIADTENASIKLIAANCSVVVTVATERHGLKTPTGLAVCPNTGNVYIADVGTHCVHVMTPDGHLDVLSGDGTAGYQECDGPSPARWDLPWALALDLNADLIVCDRNNQCIRKIELSKFVGERGPSQGYGRGGAGGGDDENGDAAPDPQGAQAVLQPPTKLVCGCIGTPGAEDGPATDAKFDSPSAIAVGPDGTIYVSDIGSNHLRKITPDQKTVLTMPGIYHGALGIDVDSYGRVYVANTDAKQICRIDPDGRLTVLKAQPLQKPVGIRIDSSSGVVFVADLHAFKSLRVVKCLPPTPSTIDTDLADLLCQEDQDNFADITFQVEGKKFRGHRAIIANRCPKFKVLFKKHGDSDEPLDLPEITYKAFCATMAFLYTDRCFVDETTAHEMMQLSDTYDIDRMKRLVEEYVLKRVTLENVLETLRVAHQWHAVRLKKACIKIVVRNFSFLQPQIPASGLEAFPELLTEIILSMPKSV